MSWDAALCCKCCGRAAAEYNYTHNTNPMLRKALDLPTNPWWDVLNGKDGSETVHILGNAITNMVENLAEYQEMNPPNGWGDAVGLLDVLFNMCKVSAEYPDHVWRIDG